LAWIRGDEWEEGELVRETEGGWKGSKLQQEHVLVLIIEDG
jgi:hypothetical protein